MVDEITALEAETDDPMHAWCFLNSSPIDTFKDKFFLKRTQKKNIDCTVLSSIVHEVSAWTLLLLNHSKSFHIPRTKPA